MYAKHGINLASKSLDACIYCQVGDGNVVDKGSA